MNSEFLSFLFNAYGKGQGEKIGKDTVGEYTIDTCYTLDCGWETAVWKEPNTMVIVARYPDQDTAVEGHKQWMELCEMRPRQAWSVQLNRYVEF